MPDRLTIGYVRDELRNLRRKDNATARKDGRFAVAKLMQELTWPLFDKHPKLSKTTVEKVRRQLIARVAETLNVVSTHHTRVRVAGFEGVLSDVDGFFYLSATTHKLKSMEDEREFDEDIVEVRYMRLICDRHRVVIDDISCNLTFAKHVLERLIERGACESKPVQCLMGGLPELLMLVPLFAFVSQKRGDFGCMMPFRDGLLLGNYMSTHDTWESGMRVRVISDRSGTNVIDIPVDNPFAIKGEAVSIRLTTWVNAERLGWKQRWARNEIEALTRRHPEDIKHFTAMLTIPESMDSPLIADSVVPIYGEFQDIIRHDNWPGPQKSS
jgi:hypothetical protein